MIDMHVYLPDKYRSPFLHGVFLFSKVGVLVVNFDGFFSLAYSSHLLWSWPLGRAWYHHTSLSSTLYLKGPILPGIFLRKRIMKPALLGVFDCPSAWSCTQVFNSGLGMRLCEGRFDKELFSCRNFGISKLFQTQKSFWHWFKANSFWRNSSDSYGEVFRSDEKPFVLILVKNMKWHLVGKRGLRFNMSVSKNQCSKHSFYLHE